MDLSLDRLSYLYASKIARCSTETEADLTNFAQNAYNFKATLFNVATAALITSIVVAILNPLNTLALLAVASSGILRHATLKNLNGYVFYKDQRGQDKGFSKIYEFVVYLKTVPASVFSGRPWGYRQET